MNLGYRHTSIALERRLPRRRRPPSSEPGKKAKARARAATMALSLNPMAVFGAMGSKRELPPPPSKTPKKKPLSNRDRQTPPARVKTPKSSLRPRSSSSSRPNSSGAEMMKLIDDLVESMPAHIKKCVCGSCRAWILRIDASSRKF